ncbi:MAG: M14 family metallopeptidase [Cryomorphaceae bacterium]
MKRLLTILLSAAPLFLFAQPIPQSKKVAEKFFPDFDIDMPTPAFDHRKGFTDHEEMMRFVNQQEKAHPGFITHEFIGESQKGKPVPMLTLTNPETGGDKIRVWMQGGLHGDEPASTEAMLYLIHQLLETDSLRPLLDHVELKIVPMANVDGCESLHRHAANGLDLNRDQTKLQAPESIFLKKAFIAFNPEVALDFHEFRSYRRDFAKLGDWGVTTKFDVMFLYSGNLNVDKGLRELTKSQFVDPAKSALDGYDLHHSDYFTSTRVHGEIQFNRGATNPRSSATSYALTNCIASLIEVRGVALGRTSYKRRVFTGYAIALSYLQSAVENVDEVRAAIEKADALENEMVVRARRTRLGEEIPFIDLGKNEYITLPSVVRDAWLSKPSLVRSKPEAYLILPGNEKAVENLRIYGLEVEELTAEEQQDVEAYEVVKYQQDPFKYEGVHLQKVETQVRPKTKTFPPGTHRVKTDQKYGHMLAELLEPEASSGFVRFEVIKTELGSELPVYRVVKTRNP